MNLFSALARRKNTKFSVLLLLIFNTELKTTSFNLLLLVAKLHNSVVRSVKLLGVFIYHLKHIKEVFRFLKAVQTTGVFK